MDTPTKVAFGCYLGAVALSLAFGALYLLRREFMPYHRVAAGSSWEELSPGLRILILAMLRGVGGLFLANGLAMLTLLLFPFRGGERWAQVALPLVGLAAALPTLSSIQMVRSGTPARPPRGLALLHTLLLALGALISLGLSARA